MIMEDQEHSSGLPGNAPTDALDELAKHEDVPEEDIEPEAEQTDDQQESPMARLTAKMVTELEQRVDALETARETQINEQLADVLANRAFVFELEREGEEPIRLPLYPQTYGYIRLVVEKAGELWRKWQELMNPGMTQRLKELVHAKKSDDQVILALLEDFGPDVRELCQLVFERRPNPDGHYTVLTEEIFDWHFDLAVLQKVYEVFCRQNDIQAFLKNTVARKVPNLM